jgi:SAM-dependent methyltransferase
MSRANFTILPCRLSASPSLGFRQAPAQLQFRPAAQIIDRFAGATPWAYALFRASECKALAALEIVRPVLDLGCGTGDFAAWALDAPVEAGVDLSRGRLRLARERGGHLSVAQTDAAALSFADQNFGSVIAVSVCEHLADAQGALAETFRVLRPRGRFIATIVLNDIHEHLFYPRLFQTLRLRWLANLYLRLHDHVFHHIALHSREEWEKMVVAAGFGLVVSRKIVSPRLTRWFDFWLITAWPYKLMQWIGVQPFVWRPKSLRKLCWKWFPAIDEEYEEEGSVLLVVAEKPG